MFDDLLARCLNPECAFAYRQNNGVLALHSPMLEIIESNVHGNGFDHMFCPTCKREYYVIYKIDKIERLDLDTGE